MISFGEKKASSKHIPVIRRWVEDALPPEMEDIVVMVNELNCLEPGCAPVETVITLLDPAKPKMFKLFKPASEVQPAEVLTGLRDILAGGTAPEHQTG
mmetsp:Transcript_42931/g.94057  ORF Transcript_42931/g.94057 Transcript_42931/m.94057 type:complete len:98 (+) Transcript_42931:314-607(+)